MAADEAWSRVAHDDIVGAADGATIRMLVAPAEGSPLSLQMVCVAPGSGAEVGAGADQDVALFVVAGAGVAALAGEEIALDHGMAVHLAAGEHAWLTLGADAGEPLRVARFTIAYAGSDVHAPLGGRSRIVGLALGQAESATGSRSFQVLLGPENGCCRATLFVGVVPPGAAPWHFHQYDEIICILRGAGAYHQATGPAQEMRPGSAVRIRSRDVHINENRSTEDMHVLGLFTPAGSPVAAYLAPADRWPPHPG